MTVPSPLITMQRMRDTKQDMQTRRRMNHKMRRELPVGMHVQPYSETGSLYHFFRREYLMLKSYTCSTGATRMGSLVASWAATWAACLVALLVEGLARGLAALGVGLAGGMAGGLQPCDKQFALAASHVKYNFLLAKTFARLFLALHDKCIVGRSGGAQPFWGLVSPVSCMGQVGALRAHCERTACSAHTMKPDQGGREETPLHLCKRHKGLQVLGTW